MNRPARGFSARRLEYLRERFEAFGIRPSKKMGQNFLLDRNQVTAVCRDAELYPLDTVLEVGPGSGLLTEAIARTGARVLCVEIDLRLRELAAAEAAEFDNVEVMEGDILRTKNAINPRVLDRLSQILTEREGHTLKCVSNLPYCIAGPFVANLCSDPRPWERGVFMIQYEMAERLAAQPGTEAYGNLSVLAQLATSSTRLLRAIPPQVFWPRPKVKSAVVRMDFKPAHERNAIPWKRLRAVTTAIFGKRRKTMRNVFRGLFGKGRKTEVGEWLASLGFDPNGRAERLSPEEMLRLATAFAEIGAGQAPADETDETDETDEADEAGEADEA